MRMSCNGCRVLRKGCSENCSIRPCLQWIKTPESQANATVFLAKFYGRAGLMNLINAGPDHLRPAIFRSLLYEACGRIVNPIYGSVGLLWSGSWQLCQNAVEAVLRGAAITPMNSDTAETDNGPPLKAYDIRHITKEENPVGSSDLRRVRTRCRFKRSGVKQPKEVINRSTSHDSSLSHQSEAAVQNVELNQSESSLGSGETTTFQLGAEPESSIELELTLGFELVTRTGGASRKKDREVEVSGDLFEGACKMELGMDYPAVD